MDIWTPDDDDSSSPFIERSPTGRSKADWDRIQRAENRQHAIDKAIAEEVDPDMDEIDPVEDWLHGEYCGDD